MDIDKDLIEHVAKVARLKLTSREIDEFLPQLKEILSAFSEIDRVDTEGTEPSFHSVRLNADAREDIPAEPLPNIIALENVKSKKEGYIKGPRVI